MSFMHSPGEHETDANSALAGIPDNPVQQIAVGVAQTHALLAVASAIQELTAAVDRFRKAQQP